jgi:hypothetical protein
MSDLPQDRSNEPTPLWMWLASWTVVALLWLWYFVYRDFDRDALALGGITGIVLTIWAMEMSGNKVPPRKSSLRSDHHPPPQ